MSLGPSNKLGWGGQLAELQGKLLSDGTVTLSSERSGGNRVETAVGTGNNAKTSKAERAKHVERLKSQMVCNGVRGKETQVNMACWFQFYLMLNRKLLAFQADKCLQRMTSSKTAVRRLD